MPELSKSDTLPPSADVEVQRCDQDCQEAATFSYRWDWGATGVCCALHATLLQQASETLKRSVAVHPLQRAAVPDPLLRDERIQLTAKHLVLEAELADAKLHGLETFRRNGDLQVQLNSAVVKERELKAQLSDAGSKLQQLQAAHNALQNENGTLLVELQRLRSLETFVNERAEREAHERGLEERPTTVDG